jgi:DNA mismatch repair protein MutS
MASTAIDRWKLMASSDSSRLVSSDGARAGEERFRSILFARETPPAATTEPEVVADLNLDQVVDAMTVGRERYELGPFFHTPLHDVDGVRYRHQALRDLERPELRATVVAFASAMERMREHLARMEKLHHPLQRHAWFRDALDTYCQAVASLAGDLAREQPASRAFRQLRDYLDEHTASSQFTTLAAETRELAQMLGAVRYAVHIHGARVTVSDYLGEPDYTVDVEATFARFQQGAVGEHLAALPDAVEMSHVEERILELVARLNRDVFATLADYCARYAGYLDATIARFDREVQFYLAYLEMIDRLRAEGLPFCYPEVSESSKEISATETFDLALANRLVPKGTVVLNDLRLDEAERVFVVSGPNNGGKTTFARTVGQLHHLGGLGLPVPGRHARLFLPDRIYTHFEKKEDIETLRGKFEDELVRVHAILEHATSRSVIVMNESFNSTTLNDALLVGTAVMRRILDLGALAVYVTFVDELASLSEATVSMVSEIVPDNPAERTFKVVRKPAEGLAYAWAIAEKHGLTYERLTERIGP